jgi:SnoaL-like domain
MSARSEIENVLARYCWAFHVDDVPFMGECFGSDAIVTFPSGRREGRAAVLEELDLIRDGFRVEGVRPFIAINLFITRAEEQTIAAHTGFLVTLRNNERAVRLHRCGYYDDVFALEEGAWRIIERTVVTGEAA